MAIRTHAAQSIVALLGSVTVAANTVTKVVDTAGASVDMLDRFVQRANTRQKIEHQIEDQTWKRNLLISASRTQEAIETKLSEEYKDPNRLARFDKIYADLEAVLNAA